MKITVVGTGYVGLVTGACFSDSGNSVCCVDVDEKKIQELLNGGCPIYEPGLEEILSKNIDASRLEFTTDRFTSYQGRDGIFICVGTPPQSDGTPDLSYVMSVAEDIANAIDSDPNPINENGPVVVVKSTVPVGTSDLVAKRIKSITSKPFSIGNNPEFLKEGAAIRDFTQPDRVVCGVHNEHAAKFFHEIYKPFMRKSDRLHTFDPSSSEMVKYASNAMLACKISFINEIATLCEKVGANIEHVREGMCADSRIGPHFFFPGLGYGGSCFPKDTLAVVSMGNETKFQCELNESVHRVNQAQRIRFLNRIKERLGNSIKGAKIAFWGLAFKPKTDDVREAPAIDIAQGLLKEGASLVGFDSAGANNFKIEVPEIEIKNNMYETIKDADVLIICTEWNEFRAPDFEKIKELLKSRLIFDGRNLYELSLMERHGFEYHSIGRPTVNF